METYEEYIQMLTVALEEQSYYEQFCSGTAVEDIAKQMLQLLYTAPTNHIEWEERVLVCYSGCPRGKYLDIKTPPTFIQM